MTFFLADYIGKVYGGNTYLLKINHNNKVYEAIYLVISENKKLLTLPSDFLEEYKWSNPQQQPEYNQLLMEIEKSYPTSQLLKDDNQKLEV